MKPLAPSFLYSESRRGALRVLSAKLRHGGLLSDLAADLSEGTGQGDILALSQIGDCSTCVRHCTT